LRRLSRLGGLLVAGALLLLLVARPAAAQDDAGDPAAEGLSASDTIVDVIKVDGLLDPVNVDFLVSSIAVAQDVPGLVGIVLQVDSNGAVVDDTALAELVGAMRDSDVPVSVWVGPSGSKATGEAALLGGHAAYLGIAPGSSWGLGDAEVPAELLEGAVREVPVRPLSAGEARDLGLSSFDAPTVGDFLVNLPEFESNEVTQGDQVRREPVTAVVFSQLPLIDQLMHTVASPAVAYLLFTVGMALLIFELFTAGIGVAGLVGAGSFVLGCYGLAVLPARGWAVALLVASMIAFAVDVQTGVPRVWTGIGFALYALGSLFLYEGVAMSWITLVVAFVGVALAFVGGMPSMVRTRFSTPTIGREWMVGEMGRAVTAVNPDGVVQVRDALWRAFTNRATPIEELDRVRVVGIEGLVLEVEPEEGAARDYRERARGGA
jgi:membrane-bound serine protease (ClpP class)